MKVLNPTDFYGVENYSKIFKDKCLIVNGISTIFGIFKIKKFSIKYLAVSVLYNL